MAHLVVGMRGPKFDFRKLAHIRALHWVISKVDLPMMALMFMHELMNLETQSNTSRSTITGLVRINHC